MAQPPGLWCALLKFQGMAPKISKSSANPYFKSSYASLDTVVDALRAPLTKCGLVVTQHVRGDAMCITVTTRITHAASGEFTEDALPMAPVDNKPQSVGSCITYARRYGLLAILGLAPEDEDDDGNKGSGRDASPNTYQNRQEGPKSAPQATQTPAPVSNLKAECSALRREILELTHQGGSREGRTVEERASGAMAWLETVPDSTQGLVRLKAKRDGLKESLQPA